MPAGRPTDFTPELGLDICARIASGESLREICRDPLITIDRRTVHRWVLKGAEENADDDLKTFCRQYEESQKIRADELFDEILDIAHDGSNDWEVREGKKGNTYIALNTEAVARSRIRIDALKWYLSKLMPKRFSDRVEQVHSGSVDVNPAAAFLDALRQEKE